MTVANLLGALDGPDLLILLAIVLLLFGGAKLPQLARSLGEAKREFHRATTDEPAVPNSSGPSAPEVASEPDTVIIDRAELERLRRAAGGDRPS
jgi:sec-independent protein translocase protein TatA